MKILAASCSILALVLLSPPVHAQATASASASVSAAPQAQLVQQPMFAPQFQMFSAPVFSVPTLVPFAVAQPCLVGQPEFGVNRFSSININGFGGGFGGARAFNGGGRNRTNINIRQRIR